MKKTVKIILITACLLMAVCAALTSCAMQSEDGDAAGGIMLECNRREVRESFDGIRIDTDTADIRLMLAEDGVCRVECLEFPKARHEVGVTGGELVVQIDDRRTLLDQAVVSLESPHIYVYLPGDDYRSLVIDDHTGRITIDDPFKFDTLSITSTTGAVKLDGVRADRVDVSTTTGGVELCRTEVGEAELAVSTGRVTVSDLECGGELCVTATTGSVEIEAVSCGSFVSTGTTGGITLRQVTAEGKMRITRRTGGVTFDGADAAEIDVETTTGSVRGSLLSGKTFTADTSTGAIDLPENTSSAAPCRIRTTTGGIKITVEG